nr:hypothetical protein [Tanacetum cinerariifolium]
MRRIEEEARRLAVIREFVFFSSVANDVTGTDCKTLVASLLDPTPVNSPAEVMQAVAMMPTPEHTSRNSSTKSGSKEEAIDESAKIDILKTNLVQKTQWKSSKETEIKICGAAGSTTSFVGVHSKVSIQAERHFRKLV